MYQAEMYLDCLGSIGLPMPQILQHRAQLVGIIVSGLKQSEVRRDPDHWSRDRKALPREARLAGLGCWLSRCRQPVDPIGLSTVWAQQGP